MQHLLSIIVPVYNAEKYLSCCLDSILNQSYKFIEVILVDDGSNDLSGDICDQYKERDKRIRVIHKKNEGCSVARNVGIENAKGDLIAFVDADDIIDYQIYEILIHNLTMTKSDVSSCTYLRENDKRNMKPVKKHEIIPEPLIFEGNEIFVSVTRNSKSIEGYIWNKVWKQSLIKHHKFREDIAMCEDSIFTWETLKDAKRVCYCDLPMYHYLIQNSSATRSSSIEKYMGALTSYEIMLSDENVLPREVVNNLSEQYLGWNLLVFNQLIKQKKNDMHIYRKVKENCIQKKAYIYLLRPASRICVKSITTGGGYYQAKIVSVIIGKLLELKNKIRKE